MLQWRWLCYGPAIAQAITCVLLIWLYYPPKHPRGVRLVLFHDF